MKPDFVLTVADRFETMATAIASSYMNIPLIHTQGGEVTGSIDESVRHAITKLAHVHFPATERAQKFLLKMGENAESIFLCGCPAMDLLNDVNEADLNSIINQENFGVGDEIDPKSPYIVILQHPVTTEFGSAGKQIKETLNAAKRLNKEGIQVLWLWPNVDAGSDEISKVLRTFREKENSRKFHFYKNFLPEDYAAVINSCSCIIGNSSSGIREASFLGVPSVNIGSRQHARERASNCMTVDYNTSEIYSAARKQIDHGRYEPSKMFGDGRAGVKIVDIIATLQPNIQKTLSYLEEFNV